MILLIYPILSALCLTMLVSGCAHYNVVPERLEDQVNHKLRFAQVKDNPDVYKGKVMVVGGEVLSIDRQNNMTKIEVLQLPLTDDFIPADRRTTTEGRFIALSRGKDPLDPAVLEKGTAITIVGEILGSEKISVGKDHKEGPVFGIKDLTIWDEMHYWGRPYDGSGLWGQRGYYAGYRPFGYPYY